jgi:hypothetical protein
MTWDKKKKSWVQGFFNLFLQGFFVITEVINEIFLSFNIN